MALPTKTTITQIQLKDPVSPSVANKPHQDIELTLDAIITYLGSSTTGYFEKDDATTTGLTFGYRAGKVQFNNTIVEVAAGTLALTASNTNYIEVDSAGVVSVNTSGFTLGKKPLWVLVADTSTITTYSDKRTCVDNSNAVDKLLVGTTTDDGVNKLQVNGDIRVDGTTATTVGAAGAASALPATPVGYLQINIGGTNYKLPYYNT
jgi:hypothetical protein